MFKTDFSLPFLCEDSASWPCWVLVDILELGLLERAEILYRIIEYLKWCRNISGPRFGDRIEEVDFLNDRLTNFTVQITTKFRTGRIAPFLPVFTKFSLLVRKLIKV